jgi:hypothetical protein
MLVTSAKISIPFEGCQGGESGDNPPGRRNSLHALLPSGFEALLKFHISLDKPFSNSI